MLAVLLINQMTTKRRLIRKENVAKAIKDPPEPLEEEYCRTCLGTNDLEEIFFSQEMEHKRSNDFKLVTGLDIKMGDGWSQKICIKCEETLKQALQFRRTSRKAEKTLLGRSRQAKASSKCANRLKKRLKGKTKKLKEEDLKVEYNVEVEMFDNNYHDDVNNYEIEVPLEDNADISLENYEDVPFVDDEDPEEYTKYNVKQPRPRTKRLNGPAATSFKCKTCNKEFRMKATYKAHMRFHTNYRVCESCGKRCRNNNQLQEHKRARHGLGRIHKCAYCEYSSATKEALTIHERRHTGERPYVCDHCGATFHRRSNLVQHIAIHLPEKNFQCQICLKWEKSKKLLQVHEYKMHRENPYRYACPACGDTFSRPGNARQHLARTHGVARHCQGDITRVQVLVPKKPSLLESTFSAPTC